MYSVGLDALVIKNFSFLNNHLFYQNKAGSSSIINLFPLYYLNNLPIT
jgi:hypothetical protein